MVFLDAGGTTREEVLIRFGEPAAILDDERTLIYYWQVARGYALWAVGAGYTGAGGIATIKKNYLVLLEFNEDGRLKRFERTSAGLFESVAERINRWTSSEGVKLDEIRRAAERPVSQPRGRFVINPVSKPDSNPGKALATLPPLRVKIGDFKNDGDAVGKAKFLIGQRTAAFGVVTDDIYMTAPLTNVVRDAIAAQWKAVGHILVDNDQDFTITGRVLEFKLETPVFPSWPAIGRLDVIIEVSAAGNDAKRFRQRYQSENVEKTMFGPSKEHFETVITACLQDLMYQMASDRELKRYLWGKPVKSAPNQTLQSPAKGASPNAITDFAATSDGSLCTSGAARNIISCFLTWIARGQVPNFL